MMRSAEGAFPDCVRPPEGGYWEAGGRLWKSNPRFYIPQAIYHVVRLWFRCQGGMGGLSHLPAAGGINDQPAWLMRSFGVLDAAEAEARKARGD